MQHIIHTDNNLTYLCKVVSVGIEWLEKILEIDNVDCLECLGKGRTSLLTIIQKKKEEIENLELIKYDIDSKIMSLNLNKFNASAVISNIT